MKIWKLRYTLPHGHHRNPSRPPAHMDFYFAHKPGLSEANNAVREVFPGNSLIRGTFCVSQVEVRP